MRTTGKAKENELQANYKRQKWHSIWQFSVRKFRESSKKL